MKTELNEPSLIGFYHYTLDPKNRLAIPAKFRTIFTLKGAFILSQGMEGCLTLHTFESWNSISKKLDNLPLNNKKDQRGFKRILFASASLIRVDGEGRILLPQNLVEYAQMYKEVIMIGMGQQLEIWAKERWDRYFKGHKNSFTQHARVLEI